MNNKAQGKHDAHVLDLFRHPYHVTDQPITWKAMNLEYDNEGEYGELDLILKSYKNIYVVEYKNNRKLHSTAKKQLARANDFIKAEFKTTPEMYMMYYNSNRRKYEKIPYNRL